MKRLTVAILAALAAPLAWAQQPPITATPLTPPDQTAPAPEPDVAAQPPLTPPQPPQPAPAAPNVWLPEGAAVIQALDKVNAESAVLTIKPGETSAFGALSIQARRCVVRPPDVPQDAAAYLVITDSHADEPSFQGWMLKSNPALSMLEHPIYDVRVLGCQR